MTFMTLPLCGWVGVEVSWYIDSSPATLAASRKGQSDIIQPFQCIGGRSLPNYGTILYILEETEGDESCVNRRQSLS